MVVKPGRLPELEICWNANGYINLNIPYTNNQLGFSATSNHSTDDVLLTLRGGQTRQTTQNYPQGPMSVLSLISCPPNHAIFFQIEHNAYITVLYLVVPSESIPILTYPTGTIIDCSCQSDITKLLLPNQTRLKADGSWCIAGRWLFLFSLTGKNRCFWKWRGRRRSKRYTKPLLTTSRSHPIHSVWATMARDSTRTRQLPMMLVSLCTTPQIFSIIAAHESASFLLLLGFQLNFDDEEVLDVSIVNASSWD
jgi:hypothetical protein